MPTLADLLRASQEGDPDPVSRPHPEAVILELQYRYARLQRSLLDPLFVPGSIVTPLPGSNLRGEGEPHIVVTHVGIEPAPQAVVEQYTRAGVTPEVRLMYLGSDGKQYVCVWVERHMIDAWRPT